MPILLQNTAVTVAIGPILGTDFLTPQTSVTLSSGHAELIQPGSVSSTDISGRAWSAVSNGIYQLGLVASDTSVVGPLLIHIHAASTQPLATRFDVLSPTGYAALLAAGAIPANVQQVNGSLTAASNIQQAALGIAPLTVGSGSSTTLVSTNLSNATSAFYVGRTLVFTSGALAGQATAITAYNGATKQLTVAQMTGAPASGDTAVIV